MKYTAELYLLAHWFTQEANFILFFELSTMPSEAYNYYPGNLVV